MTQHCCSVGSIMHTDRARMGSQKMVMLCKHVLKLQSEAEVAIEKMLRSFGFVLVILERGIERNEREGQKKEQALN